MYEFLNGFSFNCLWVLVVFIGDGGWKYNDLILFVVLDVGVFVVELFEFF